MKAQWMKRIKKIAVFILTSAILINAVDCNRLFVSAETVEVAGENSGNESNLNSGAGEDANAGDDGSSGETGDSGDAGDTGSAGDTEIAGDGESAGDEAADTGSTGSESNGENESGNAGNSEGAGTEAGDGTGDSGNLDSGTGDGSSPEEDSNGKIPADVSVSGNDIPADTVVGTTVTVNVTNSDGDAVTGATVKFTETDTGNEIDFTEGSNGAYTAELSAAGNISISANGYIASNQSYENDGTSSFDIKLTGKYSYTVEITGSEYGSVTLNGKDVTGTFEHYKSSLPLVIEAKNHGYIYSVSIGGNTITLANNAEQEQTVADGDTLSVNFAPLCATTITKTGEGTVYTASDTSTDLSGNTTLYYLPSAAPELTVKANTGWYIDSVKNGETEAIASNVLTDEFSVTPDEGKNLTVVFKKKWGEEFASAVEDKNGSLKSAVYNSRYGLCAPESENTDYSYSWSVGDEVSGVYIDATKNELVIPRNAAGRTFTVTATATLMRGEVAKESVTATISVTPGEIAAVAKKDYKFTKKNTESEWITEIQVLKDESGNNFSQYSLTGTNLLQSATYTDATELALGAIEVEDGELVLSGMENGEPYSATISNLQIDTKAPIDLELIYEVINKDGNKESITPGATQYQTNKTIIITAKGTDAGSGLTNTKAVLTYAGGELEATFDASGCAKFCLDNGDYAFSKLKVTDVAGNTRELETTASFSVDTTLPNIPEVTEANDTWRAGSQLDYSLSSSEDVVKFVICEDSGSVDWGNIETEVLKGNTPDGVEVLDSANGTVKWEFTQEGNVLNKSYQLKALDDHGNFSVDAAAYIVKIDNETPVIGADGIKFTKADGSFELSLNSTILQKINANVIVNVTGISDQAGSGVSKIALADGKEDSAEETELIYDDKNQASTATVEFTEQKEYHFKELRIYDKMGNCYKESLNVNFDIDTTRPDTPGVTEANDTWRAGSQLDYSLSSSEDVVKFVICEDSGSVDWGNIETEVLKGNTPDGVEVLNSADGTVKWEFTQEGNVLNKSYQLKALDGHGNFSVDAAAYIVKIDNETPVIDVDGIKFTKVDGIYTLSLDSTNLQKINAHVTVNVTGISDQAGSGVSKIALADGKEDNAIETELIYDVKNQASTATVEFTEDKEYHFKELRIYDKMGNCYKKSLNVNFEIDTRKPDAPEIVVSQKEAEKGEWIKGTNCIYTISSKSKDTVCFEIVNMKNGVTVFLDDISENISDEGVSVNWEVPVSAEDVFISTYKILAKDCSDSNNANVSDPTEYTVRIDNRKPVVDGAEFAYTENGKDLTAAANVAFNSEVTVQVNKVEDKEENYQTQVGLESVELTYNMVTSQGNGDITVVTPVEEPAEKTIKLTPEELDDTKASWKLPVEAGKYCKYSNFVITATDKLGNTAVNESLKGYTVEIDQRGPVIKNVEWNGDSKEESYWFNGDKNEHKFIVEAEDDTALKKITIFALDEQGNKTASLEKNLTGNEKTATVDFGAWVYDREGNQSYPDKKERYTIEVTDRFDNTTSAGSESEDFSKDPAPREVRIDKTLPVITGAVKNAAEVTYGFSNAKAANATVLDGQLTEEDHLVNGVLLSKNNVTVTVNAFDPKMNQNSENANGVASGIVKAELVVETEGKAPEAVTFAKEEPNLESEYDYKFELKGTENQETVFVLKAIRLTDLAGNVKEYTYEDGEQAEGKLGALTVVVDHKGPEADFTIEGYTYENQDGLTGWCSATNENPLKLTASASDGYGIKSIDWYRTTFEKGSDVAELQPFENEINPSEAVTAFQNTLKLVQDQDQLYAVKVTDWAGNEKVFCNNIAKETGSRVRIDSAVPQNYALIHWEGDHNSSFNDIENEYEVSQKGYVYNKNKVTLSVLVRDGLVTGLLNADENGKVCSDIERVEVTINHENSSEKKVVRNGQTVRIVEVGGETYLEFKFEGIELTAAEGSEVEKYIESIVIYDYAGNQTPAEGRLLSDEIKYVLDSKAPKLTVDYHDGSYVESALFPETYFYKEDPSVNATIEERYFYSEDVKANLSEPEAANTLNQSEWSMGSVEHSSVFSASSDGKYRFSLEYMDRSGNEMTGEEVSNGKYISKFLVMDTTVPKIEITYEHNGQDVTDEIYDGNFFAGTVKATVRIHEMNFDPDMVEIEATGKNSESNAGIGIGWDGGWTKESEEVNVNTVTFEQQGTYQFTCSCKDIVGHEAERPAQSHFVVDTTKPEVEITYDLNDPLNEKYYKEARTATVHVTDRSFDPEQVEFLIETSGPQPAISEWTHRGGAGCEDQPTYHVDGCVYEATVAFAEDGDYSLGFSCVDKAGNESNVVMTDPFTVDQTVPEMLVTYNNNDAQNEYYYKEQRIGTVTITEHNFNPEDVQIVTTAQNTDVAAPGISGWRNEGDVHTTTIAYSADADYTFDISYSDMAGNEAEVYGGDRFVVDTTVPVLAITDIEDKSANNGTVAPGIEWSDINLDTDGVFMLLTGANNGEVTVATAETVIEGGMKIQYQDFPREKGMDDLYTFHATVADLAGNVSEETVMFSVNRFGSVYVFDDMTQDIVDHYYINKPAHLNVTEINVDTLEFKEITYSKDGDIVTMKAGEDYAVMESGTETTWKSYTYDIYEDNFEQEGAYAVTIYSEDRATNKSNNIVKEKVIDFVMDTTVPTVVVTGVDNEEQYNENSRTITIDAKDNIFLAGVTAYLNDQPVQTFDEETLLQNGGVVTMEIGSSNEWQTLVIRAIDAAGNEGSSDTRVFLITRNVLVQWYRNVPLFWGSIIGMTVLAALIIFFLFWKKKKEEEKAA